MPEPPETPARLTLRVYTVAPDGTLLRDRGTVRFTAEQCGIDVFALSSAYPPCACARCAGRATTP
ncbi:hypothetical protein [Streptomyces sp. ODS28]|uniref:hypothetical protein n=1 Tax=Streptomyces sp. ODS28 TaxID=3136688 RepID=UPI0031E6A07D